MTHRYLMDRFLEISHTTEKEIDIWTVKGKNTLKIRLHSGHVLVFTYKSPKDWMMETYESYLNRQKYSKRKE